jgi:beta-lactamase regulating signal transducer with metallopeptidase domain
MPMLSTIVDGVINLNIALAAAFGLWLVARGLLNIVGHKRAFVLQLSLLNWLFVAVLIGPVLVTLNAVAVQQGWVGRGTTPNLSDYFVAQYLSGNISMRPSDFEWVLSLRDTVTRALLAPVNWTSYAVLALLGLGHLVLVARFALNAWRLRQVLKQSYAWRRFGRLHLCLTDATHVPFSTRGLRNHYIMIPTALLSDKPGLQMAIAHELQHMRQGDIGWEIGLETLRLMFFWNPVFHIWKRAVDRLRELACDQQLLARGRFDAVAYSDCLLRICRNGLRRGQLGYHAVGMVQTTARMTETDPIRFLRYRITSLLAIAPPLHGRRFGMFILAPLAVAIALGSVAIQRQGDWSHDRLMLSTIVNLERLRSSQGY